MYQQGLHFQKWAKRRFLTLNQALVPLGFTVLTQVKQLQNNIMLCTFNTNRLNLLAPDFFYFSTPCI